MVLAGEELDMSSVLEYAVKSGNPMPPVMKDRVEGSETFDSWVRQNVLPAFESFKENPERVYTAADVRAHLAEEVAKRR